MSKRMLLINLGIVLGLITYCVHLQGLVKKDDNYYAQEIEYKDSIIYMLNHELVGWRDHSERMKKIIGIKKEGEITWVDKVVHPIDIRKAVKYSPRDTYFYYDEETGTYKKPKNYINE